MCPVFTGPGRKFSPNGMDLIYGLSPRECATAVLVACIALAVLAAVAAAAARTPASRRSWRYEGPPLGGSAYAPVVLKGVLTRQECEILIRAAASHFRRSTVMGADGREVSGVRTSETAWMTEDASGRAWPAVLKIREAAEAATGIHDKSLYEDLQLLRYRPGGLYRAHFDSAVVMSEVSSPMRRRATVIVYLNDGYEGGETAFPKLNLRVRPGVGDGLMFWNLDARGEEDAMSLHESLPVRSGVKYNCQLWIR